MDDKWETKQIAYWDGYHDGYDDGRKSRAVWFWLCCVLSFVVGFMFVRMW